jgi:hypothetical protein
MKKGFRKEHINYNGLSWRIDIRFWTNHNCEQCDLLNEENPVENRLFHTYSGKEFRAHRKLHKEQK